MFDTKPFKKTRHLACYNCECTGYYNKKSIFLKLFSWEAVKLQSKEGLALLNGTQFMTAFGIYCLLKAHKLSYL